MPTRDVRKMKPLELVKFSLRVLRRTPASRMRRASWFRPALRLERLLKKANILYSSHGRRADVDKYFRFIFRHRKDCFACAVGCVLLADGREAAQKWEIGQGMGEFRVKTFSKFATQFFKGMSHEFESNSLVARVPTPPPSQISTAAGRRAAIAYAEAELKKRQQRR